MIKDIKARIEFLKTGMSSNNQNCNLNNQELNLSTDPYFLSWIYRIEVSLIEKCYFFAINIFVPDFSLILSIKQLHVGYLNKNQRICCCAMKTCGMIRA